MITKIHKSKDLSGTLRYVYREDANPVVVASTATGFDRESVYRELAASSARVARLKEDTTHMILSLPAEDDVSELVWEEIVTEYMEAMGYGECLYVAIKHNDTDHPHVHIVASRVDATGHAVDDFYNFPRSERAARMIEARHGLARVECSWELPGRRVAQGEYHLDRRDGRAKEKQRIHDEVRLATLTSSSIVGLSAALKSRGITLVPRLSADRSEVKGVYFQTDSVKISGSKVARDFSWRGLTSLLDYDHERDHVVIAASIKTPEADRPRRKAQREGVEAIGLERADLSHEREEPRRYEPSRDPVDLTVSEEIAETDERVSRTPMPPPRGADGQGRGVPKPPLLPEKLLEPRRGPAGEPRLLSAREAGEESVRELSFAAPAGASDRRELALSVMKAALDRAPKDATWKELADNLQKASVTLVPEGTQGDYGRICGLYIEYEGVRLPASEVDRGASYDQLTRVLGTLERSHLGDVCRVVAIAGLGDVHVLVAKRRAALAPEKTGPELELPGFVDRDYKGAREKFEEKLAASRARSAEERREVKAPEELNRPGFIDRVYRGPKEKFLDELARYEAGERRARRGPDPELEARLPGFVDRVYKGPKEKFQEDLRAAGIAYPGDKSGEGELARGAIEGALAGERERARAGEHGASPGGREARRDEREGGGERERDGSRDDGLRRPGFKDFTPVGANEKLLREVKERLGEDAYQRALDARRALGSSEGGKLEDAIGEVERVISASERTADEELIARFGGKDLLASVGRLAPEDDSPWDEPVKRSKELPYTRREVDARIRATGKPLVDVARQPFVGRVRETFDTKAWGRVALIEGEDRVTMMKARENDPRFVPGNVIASTPGERGLQVRSVAKGTRENPYTRHEIQARVAHLTANKPLADVTREPFKGHVKDAFYDERGDRIAVLEGPKQVALVKVSPEDKRIRPDALAITTPTDRGLALSVHARGEKENPYSHKELDAMLARQTTPRITPADRRVVGQVQRTMHVNDGQRVAIIGNAKEHAVVPLREDQDVKRGDQVESRPDGRGGVEVKSAGFVLDQKKVEEKVARLASEPAKLTEKPVPMQVKEVFVMRGKGEVAIVADDKHHAVVPTAGLGTKLSRGEAVDVSVSSEGVTKVARAPEKARAETPTRMEERGQDIRAPEPSTRLVRDEEPAPAPGKQEAARVPDAPVATPQGRENQNRTTTHQRGLSRAQVIAKAKATGTVLLHPDKEPMQGKVVEKFVIRDKGEAAMVVNDKKHAIIYTEGRGNKLEVGKHVALSPDGKGDVRIEPARAVEKRVAEQNKPTPAPSNPSTTSEEREAPGTQTSGTSYHDNDALSRAQVIAKAKATGTEKLRLDKEPMVGRVVEKFVVRGKGEAALVVNDKNHVIIYTKGREDQLEVGKYVALSPDGKGSSNVESVKAVEKGGAEKSKSAPTPLSERAQPERGVERKQDCRAVLARVEAGAKQKAPALSAIDRARPGKDGEPPAMEQRPTMKEWLKAQQDSGVDAKAPIKHGVIEGKVDRDPVYLKEGKHYVISQDDGSKKTLESSPKLEELRDKRMRFVRNEIGEIAKNLEVSRGRSR